MGLILPCQQLPAAVKQQRLRSLGALVYAYDKFLFHLFVPLNFSETHKFFIAA